MNKVEEAYDKMAEANRAIAQKVIDKKLAYNEASKEFDEVLAIYKKDLLEAIKKDKE